MKEFGKDALFNFLVYERSNLIYLLKVIDHGKYPQFWVIKDQKEDQKINLYCDTLFKLPKSKGVKDY